MSTQQHLGLVNSVVQTRTPPPPPTGGNDATGNGAFIPGVGSNTIVALLLVMEDLMKIANIYGAMLIDQLKTQAEIANSIGKYTRYAANEQATQMRIQAGMSIAGGIVSGITSGIAFGTTFHVPAGEVDAQLKGAENFRQYLEPDEGNNNVSASASNEVSQTNVSDEELDKLKQKNDFVNRKKSNKWQSKEYTLEDIKNAKSTSKDPEERDLAKYRDKIDLAKADSDKSKIKGLKDSYDKKIEELRKTRDQRVAKWQQRAQGASTTAQALSSFLTGTGQVSAAKHQIQQGIEEANKQTAQAALGTAQGITGETRSNSDKYLGQSFDVTQLIAAISNANKLVGG